MQKRLMEAEQLADQRAEGEQTEEADRLTRCLAEQRQQHAEELRAERGKVSEQRQQHAQELHAERDTLSREFEAELKTRMRQETKAIERARLESDAQNHET